jgi:hypothetical protein
LTLVYIDSDDGVREERRIATSMLRPDDVDSIGALESIAPTDAVCEVRNAHLEPVLRLGYDAEQR